MLTPTRRLFVVRRRGGLGQDSIDTSSLPTIGDTLSQAGTYQVELPSTVTPTASGGGTDWSSILAPLATAGAKIGQTYVSYQNPLYNKATYYQTPQGAIYASNATTTGSMPGLTSTFGGSSIMPILLIGGVVLFMMSRR